MSLKKVQDDVDMWTGQFVPQYWPPLEMMARLAEETGEVARELNHLHGNKKKKVDENTKGLGSELVDVLFTICCMANMHGIDLEQEWNMMIEKKNYGRDNKRYERKDGAN